MTLTYDTPAPAELQSIPPGTRQAFRIPVARRSSGEDLCLTVHVVRGASDGPSLGLVAAIHGDAPYGSHVVQMVLDGLDPATLRGTVVGVPVANPVAFESGTRMAGQGWNTDDGNMNRVFPGAADGWITQRMAATLSDYVVSQVDALIDYHSGADTAIDYTLVVGDATEAQRRVFTYARLLATDFIYVHDVDPYAGTVNDHALALGKLCVIAEQGGVSMAPGFDPVSLRRAHNYLKGLGMIDGEPDLPESQLLMRGGRTLQRVDHGGILYPEVGLEALSAIIPGGTLLSRIVDPHSFEVLQEIRAPYDQSAILQTRPHLCRVNPGDYAYIIGDAGRGTRLPRLDDWRIEIPTR
jgi:predicted deacylase